MADDPLTITEVYPGYRRGGQDLSFCSCCWGAALLIWTMLGFSVSGFFEPEPYEHIGIVSLSTLIIWAVFITDLGHIFWTSLAALLIAFGLSQAWDYLPYLMTSMSMAIAIFLRLTDSSQMRRQ